MLMEVTITPFLHRFLKDMLATGLYSVSSPLLAQFMFLDFFSFNLIGNFLKSALCGNFWALFEWFN